MKRSKKKTISIKSKRQSIEEIKKLKPQEVLEILKQGNKDFVENRLTVRNNTKRVRAAALSQYPIAVVLSCLDSRLPVEDIFHRGIGEIFVARVAGNIVNDDILGSLEYACNVSTAKVLLVLGHEHCGAIRNAIKDVKVGYMTTLLAKIRPAVDTVAKKFKGKKTATNRKFVKEVSAANVQISLDTIRTRSPILKEMEENGEILILGGMYNMYKGAVVFYE